jgi:hypothetical protein
MRRLRDGIKTPGRIGEPLPTSIAQDCCSTKKFVRYLRTVEGEEKSLAHREFRSRYLDNRSTSLYTCGVQKYCTRRGMMD